MPAHPPPWASVATAVHHAGGTVHIAPVTADLTPHWEQIEPLLHPTVTAVVLAHVRGRPAPDTVRIAAELAERGITLIEDCAQAWAVTVDGQPAGSHGTIAVFSTQTWKLIATGEGGVVAADDPDLLQALRSATGDTRIPAAGGNPWRGNCRMSELTAASALPQLHVLDVLTELLHPLQARVINRALGMPNVQLVLPAPDEAARSNGSLVGVWLPTPNDARRAADRLYRDGIRHWYPSTGDLHLAANWPVADTHSEVDLACYLDIQIPMLDEHHHDEFLDAIATALAGSEAQ
jgi:dTDP-4-amino-4,6-dideoxygalactose transaminase